jgi:hypothetical protein
MNPLYEPSRALSGLPLQAGRIRRTIYFARMPISCRLKSAHGSEFCTEGCPVQDRPAALQYVRVERAEDVPPADPHSVDVAVLDMNHGWANLGHDSLVHAVQDAVCDVLPALEEGGLRVRVLSFDVRRSGMVPEPPPRYALYVGTGGPGHLDPHLNDGVTEGSQGLVEDSSWEAPTFRLFDAILRTPGTALLSVCHSFGVMCRWAGVADAVLRTPAKGGKSAGILENVLTPEGQRHPWFARFAEELPEHRRLRIVDHRLFDLIPAAGAVNGFTPIGYETLGPGGPQGDALTMMEFARDERGMMPRVFGSNHHPEIVDRSRQRMILEQKRERGEVTEDWYLDRRGLLDQYPDDSTDQRLHLTSDFTLLAPLRYFLYRALRQRAESLGLRVPVDEGTALDWDRRAEARR